MDSVPAPVCILGVHRSGASLAARLLAARGLFLGDRHDLSPATSDGSVGGWENHRIRLLNEEILARLGAAWDAPPARVGPWAGPEFADLRAQATQLGGELARRGPWGWKDPNGSLTLPFWLSQFPALRVVLCVRNPLEVAWSLEQASSGWPVERGLALWHSYTLALAGALPAGHTIVTHYDALLYDPAAEGDRLCAFLGLALPADESVDTGRLRGLRHQAATESLLHAAASAQLVGTYDRLLEGAGVVFARMRRDSAYLRGQLETGLLRQAERLRTLQAETAEFAAQQRRVAARIARLRQHLLEMNRSALIGMVRAAWRLRDVLLPRGSLARRRAARLRGWLAAARDPSAHGGDALWDVADPLYAAHIARTEPDAEELRGQRAGRGALAGAPSIQLVTLVDAGSDAALRETLASLREQTHAEWIWRVHRVGAPGGFELDPSDARIVCTSGPIDVEFTTRPGLADGEYAGILEAGARLPPWALFGVAEALVRHPDTDCVYGDHDHVDRIGGRHTPVLKPDWSPELQLSTDLLAGLTVCRSSRLRASLPQRACCGRCWRRTLNLGIARHARRIRHLRQVLCHLPGEVAGEPLPRAHDSRCGPTVHDAICELLRSEGATAPRVQGHGSDLRVRWEPRRARRASIVIPTRDQAGLLESCLSSIRRHAPGLAFELVLVDNDSGEPDARALLRELSQAPDVSVLEFPGHFNYSAACNLGARAASGDLLLFLNNDVEVVHDDWLGRMAQWLDLEGVGAVGPKLLFPDGRIQHAGVVAGMGGAAGHVFHGAIEDGESPFGSDNWYRNLSAVTAACVMLPTELFWEIGAFDEAFRLAYSDVDLCLRVAASGRRIVYTPDVRLIHHESRTRGKRVYRIDFELITRRMRDVHADGDPFFNPGLSYSEVFPTLSKGAWDTPLHLNRDLMRRLPARATLTVPDDLA